MTTIGHYAFMESDNNKIIAVDMKTKGIGTERAKLALERLYNLMINNKFASLDMSAVKALVSIKVSYFNRSNTICNKLKQTILTIVNFFTSFFCYPKIRTRSYTLDNEVTNLYNQIGKIQKERIGSDFSVEDITKVITDKTIALVKTPLVASTTSSALVTVQTPESSDSTNIAEPAVQTPSDSTNIAEPAVQTPSDSTNIAEPVVSTSTNSTTTTEPAVQTPADFKTTTNNPLVLSPSNTTTEPALPTSTDIVEFISNIEKTFPQIAKDKVKAAFKELCGLEYDVKKDLTELQRYVYSLLDTAHEKLKNPDCKQFDEAMKYVEEKYPHKSEIILKKLADLTKQSSGYFHTKLEEVKKLNVKQDETLDEPKSSLYTALGVVSFLLLGGAGGYGLYRSIQNSQNNLNEITNNPVTNQSIAPTFQNIIFKQCPVINSQHTFRDATFVKDNELWNGVINESQHEKAVDKPNFPSDENQIDSPEKEEEIGENDNRDEEETLESIVDSNIESYCEDKTENDRDCSILKKFSQELREAPSEDFDYDEFVDNFLTTFSAKEQERLKPLLLSLAEDVEETGATNESEKSIEETVKENSEKYLKDKPEDGFTSLLGYFFSYPGKNSDLNNFSERSILDIFNKELKEAPSEGFDYENFTKDFLVNHQFSDENKARLEPVLLSLVEETEETNKSEEVNLPVEKLVIENQQNSPNDEEWSFDKDWTYDELTKK